MPRLLQHKHERWRRLLAPALGFLLLASAGLLAYAHVRGEDVAASLVALDARVLPLALGLHVLAHLLWGVRYRLLAPPCGIRLSWLRGWRIVTAGVFGGAVTPGRVGGEAVKATVLMRAGATGAQASRLLLLDRSMDLLFFLATGTLAFLVLPSAYASDVAQVRWFALLGTFVLAAFLGALAAVLWLPDATSRFAAGAVARWDRLRRRPPRDAQAVVRSFLLDVKQGVADAFRNRPVRMLCALGLTVLNWTAEYAVLWVLLQGFGAPVPYLTVFLAGTVVTLVSNIPVTPGGSGVAEVSAFALIAPLAGGVSILFPVAWRAVTYLYDLVAGGIVAACTLPARRTATAATA